MSIDDPDHSDAVLELAAIEFLSPGRFAIDNPPAVQTPPEPWQAAPFVLGQTLGIQRFESSDSARQHALALLGLARRLSSNMQIRKRHPEYPVQLGAFLVADDCGALVRPEPDQNGGYALYSDPGRARQLQRQFDTAWDHSLSDPDLRSFLI